MFRFLWRALILSIVFGAGYILGREHSFEEDEDWDDFDDDDDEDEEEEEEKEEGEKGA
ncbi:hypothetical protein ACFL35_00945 [Candidatus Riflebacteria bacterium]